MLINRWCRSARLKVSSTRSDQVGLTVKHVLLETLHTTSPDGDVKMKICTDSDAARGMIHRVGCGRVRHLQTRHLWHQQALREGQFNVVRCGTKENPSDRFWMGAVRDERDTRQLEW